MITSNISALKMGLKKSSSFSDFNINILNSPYSPESSQDIFNSPQDSLLDPVKLLSHKSSPPKQLRPRGYSTTASFMPSWSDSFETSPNAWDDLEINHEDDEEIKLKELMPLKDTDLDISVEMVTKEMIMSTTASVVYPCCVSIKCKKEVLVKSPGKDLVLLVDFKENQPGDFAKILQKSMRFLSENDRLALFTTQGPLIKRVPFRVMDEITKSEFINEFSALDNNTSIIRKNKIPLQKVFESTLAAIEGRKYKNHVSSILILTDTNDEIDVSSMKIKEFGAEQPVVYTLCFGQNTNHMRFQDLSERFEGSYQCTQDMRELYEMMKGCLAEISSIQAKNVNLSLRTISSGEESDALKIVRVYENKEIFEKTTQNFQTKRNYFSVKEGINLALEVELAKATSGCEIKLNSYFLELSFNCQPLCEAPEIHINYPKELIVKTMPELLCTMPKQIDRKALENFCQIKVATKLFEAVKMANCGNKNQSIQSLMMLKKEIYAYTMFKSQGIHQMMRSIEWMQDYIQNQSFRRDSVDQGIFCNVKARN